MRRFTTSFTIVALAMALIAMATITPARADFIRGDASADGVLNIIDPILSLNYIVGFSPLECLDAADADDNGQVNVVDAVYILHHIFGGRTPPPAPFPACGDDPTPDTLDCNMPTCP